MVTLEINNKALILCLIHGHERKPNKALPKRGVCVHCETVVKVTKG